MFDSAGAFTRQFKPVEEGYVFYQSAKAGGKLVTVEEYQRLVADWERISGRSGQWKVVGLLVAFIALWTLASQVMPVPDWADWIMIGICVASITAWVGWAIFAPHRLVRGRPDVTPPRLWSEVTREAYASFDWRIVDFALLLSGLVLVITLASPERTLSWWAWLVGSGAFFAAYLWIALKKIMDRQR